MHLLRHAFESDLSEAGDGSAGGVVPRSRERRAACAYHAADPWPAWQALARQPPGPARRCLTQEAADDARTPAPDDELAAASKARSTSASCICGAPRYPALRARFVRYPGCQQLKLLAAAARLAALGSGCGAARYVCWRGAGGRGGVACWRAAASRSC